MWEECNGNKRLLIKAFLREEPLTWRAVIVDNQGNVRWQETFGGNQKARCALVNRVPDEARFVRGPVPTDEY